MSDRKLRRRAVWMEWHYGWRKHFARARSVGHAAKIVVRREHEFLTDTNHTMVAKPRQSVQWGGKTVRFSAVYVYRAGDAPPYSGPAWAETDYWFAVSYSATKPEGVTDALWKAVCDG